MTATGETKRSGPAVLASNPDTPTLPGWVGLTEAGEMLGVSRQHSYKLARLGPKKGGYRTLHRIGNSFVVVVSTAEIEERLAAKRADEAQESTPKPEN